MWWVTPIVFFSITYYGYLWSSTFFCLLVIWAVAVIKSFEKRPLCVYSIYVLLMLLITCSFRCYRPPSCIDRGRVTISWQKRQILTFWGSKSRWFLENTTWRFSSLLRPKGQFSWRFQYKKISPKNVLKTSFFRACGAVSGSIWPTSFKFPANLWSRSGKQGRTSNFFIWQSEPWCSQRIRKQNRSNISYRNVHFTLRKSY